MVLGSGILLTKRSDWLPRSASLSLGPPTIAALNIILPLKRKLCNSTKNHLIPSLQLIKRFMYISSLCNRCNLNFDLKIFFIEATRHLK